jgi:hypothetical protein
MHFLEFEYSFTYDRQVWDHNLFFFMLVGTGSLGPYLLTDFNVNIYEKKEEENYNKS